MTRIKEHLKIKLILVVLFTFIALSFAQFEEDEFEIQNTVSCKSEKLNTIYDKYKQTDLDMTDLKMWYSFGSEYYKQKDYKAALPYLWKVFVNDTSKMGKLAIRKIADAYFNLQLADSTLLACYRGLERYPDVNGLHYYAGILQMNLGKNVCAIPHYEFLVEHNPQVETYLDKLAYLYFKNEDELALDIQKQLIGLAPENPDYHTRLVFYIEYFGFDPLEELRLAFQKNPDDLKIAKQLGKAELDAGNYQPAVEKFTIILKNDPKQKSPSDSWTGILKLRAQAYEGLTNYTAAIGDYKAILGIKPSDLETMCTIATDYKMMNKFAEGKYWVKKAIAANPKSGLPHIVMAEIYEASVPFSQNIENRGRKIDDGFVYEHAIAEYEKAQKDPAYTAYARNRIELLKPLGPTQEELFFANGDTKLKYESYTSWIEE